MSRLADQIGAAWRIARDVALYRLRKREAGNLATSVTLALCLGLSVGDVGWRALVGAGMNLWAYLVNDLFDVDLDLAAPGRDVERTRFLAANRRAGWGLSVVLAVVLAVAAGVHSWGLLAAHALDVVVIVAYSGWLKRRAYLDVLSMAGWGLAMALVGFPLTSADGWKMAGLLVLLCMVTEVVQTVRDAEADARAGIRTTAVALGAVRAAWLGRFLVAASAVYTALFLDPRPSVLIAAAALVPFRPRHVERTWDAYRLLFGIAWLAVCGIRATTAGLHGLLP